MADLPFPLSGSTLVTGPSNAGKTRLTARALDAWVTERGSEGVVALDFAPEVERDGVLLGGRLTRFCDLPGGVWYGGVDAHAPRAAGETDDERLALAAANARRARRVLEAAPTDPRAVFVNDATIPLQSDVLDAATLTGYCDGATAVLNAFESDELGVDDAVSRHERVALGALRAWADRVVTLRP
jgi:hypothetical protein